MSAHAARRTLVCRAGAVWLLLMAVETAHGTFRQFVLAPYLGDLYARQVSVLSGSLLILVTAYLTGPWLRADTARAQLLVGSLWLVLTLTFEVGIGRYGLGYSWERLAADYDLARGGLMPFGMVVLMLAPWITAQLRELLALPAHDAPPGATLPQ